MVRHIALFRWNAEVTAEREQQLVERLTELGDLIPGVVHYDIGRDVGLNDGNFDFAVVADFASADAYVVYRDHPAHQAVIAECIAPIREHRASVQFEVP